MAYMIVIPKLDARLGSELHKLSEVECTANRSQLIIEVFAHLDPGCDEAKKTARSSPQMCNQ
jgi:hypothetical protein